MSRFIQVINARDAQLVRGFEHGNVNSRQSICRSSPDVDEMVSGGACCVQWVILGSIEEWAQRGIIPARITERFPSIIVGTGPVQPDA